MRMVYGMAGENGSTCDDLGPSYLALELGILIQKRLKGLDFLAHSLQADQRVLPRCTETTPTCTSSNLSLPTINFIPA